MNYTPPPSTLRLVAISAIARAVGIVIAWPINIMTNVPRTPAFAVAYLNFKNNIAPSIVLMAARNTGGVPNPKPLEDFCGAKLFSPVYYYNLN